MEVALSVDLQNFNILRSGNHHYKAGVRGERDEVLSSNFIRFIVLVLYKFFAEKHNIV